MASDFLRCLSESIISSLLKVSFIERGCPFPVCVRMRWSTQAAMPSEPHSVSHKDICMCFSESLTVNFHLTVHQSILLLLLPFSFVFFYILSSNNLKDVQRSFTEWIKGNTRVFKTTSYKGLFYFSPTPSALTNLLQIGFKQHHLPAWGPFWRWWTPESFG